MWCPSGRKLAPAPAVRVDANGRSDLLLRRTYAAPSAAHDGVDCLSGGGLRGAPGAMPSRRRSGLIGPPSPGLGRRPTPEATPLSRRHPYPGRRPAGQLMSPVAVYPGPRCCCVTACRAGTRLRPPPCLARERHRRSRGSPSRLPGSAGSPGGCASLGGMRCAATGGRQGLSTRSGKCRLLRLSPPATDMMMGRGGILRSARCPGPR